MPRKAKGIHSSPENAGVDRMPEGYADKNKDENNTMAKTLPIYHIGQKNRQNYEGKWDEESLEIVVGEYFQYCADNSVKPSKAGLRLWLGLSDNQYLAWTKDATKYGFKSRILSDAHALMEVTYIDRGESFPTFNQFLLKSGYHYAETSKIEVTGNQTTANDVADAISKLGLDQQ